MVFINTLQMWDNTTTPSFYDIPNTGELISLDLSSYTGTVMLAFYGESTVNYTNEFNDMFVDDVTISQIVGADEISNNIKIYPNPSSGLIRINSANVYNLEIFDITGKMIESKFVDNSTSVNMNKAGIYLFRFSNNNEIFTKRIIIK